MNRTILVSRSITLLMVTLVLASCAAPPALEAAPCPTSAPPACPTCPPQSCPPVAVQAIPTITSWQKAYFYEEVNLRISFDPGKKCSMDNLSPSTGGFLSYEVVVNDQAYQNYIVVALTLEKGKTLKDIETYDKTAIGVVPPPPGSEIRSLEIVAPMSRTFHLIPMPYSSIYLVCLIQGPDLQQPIDQFGPVEVGQ